MELLSTGTEASSPRRLELLALRREPRGRGMDPRPRLPTAWASVVLGMSFPQGGGRGSHGVKYMELGDLLPPTSHYMQLGRYLLGP